MAYCGKTDSIQSLKRGEKANIKSTMGVGSTRVKAVRETRRTCYKGSGLHKLLSIPRAHPAPKQWPVNADAKFSSPSICA
eukprot:IDg14086t1